MIKDLNPYLVKDRGLKKREGGKQKKKIIMLLFLRHIIEKDFMGEICRL